MSVENGTNGNVSLSTYKANLAAIIQAALAQTPQGSVLLVNSVPQNYPGNFNIPWLAYQSILYDLADFYGVAVLDMTQRWNTFAIGNAQNLYSDAITHPSVSGVWEIAQAVYDAMTDGMSAASQ